MKFCKQCGWDWPDHAKVCSVCGRCEFTDAADMPPPAPPKPPLACCPKPGCPKLVIFTGDEFCSKCGARLAPVTLAVWEDKSARPALERDVVGVLFDPSPLYATAAQMGFLPGEAEARLDQLFAHLSGVGRERLNLWVQENVLTLRAEQRDAADVRRHALEQAERVGIYTAFAQNILDVLAPEEPPRPETEADDGEQAAAAYAAFLRGDSVTPDPIFLSAEGGSSVKDMLGARPATLKVNPQGALVLFREADGAGGWVYPNTWLHFREEALRKVFPALREEQFNLLRESRSPEVSGVEPVRVFQLDASRWQVAVAPQAAAVGARDDLAEATETKRDAPVTKDREVVKEDADGYAVTAHDDDDADIAAPRRKTRRRLLAAAACVAVLVLAAGWLTRESPEDGLERAAAAGNLLKPAGESAYDYYRQLKPRGRVPESLKKRLLPDLLSASRKTLEEAYRPGGAEPSESDWKETLTLLEWASELSPGDRALAARIEYSRGQVARLGGGAGTAIESWRRAAALDSGWALPGKSLSLAYQERGDHTLGRAYLVEAIERDPGWAVPYAVMGDWFQKVLKDSAAAEPFYRKAIERAPRWAYPHASLAEAAIGEKRYGVASRELQLARSPDAVGAAGLDLDRLARELQNVGR